MIITDSLTAYVATGYDGSAVTLRRTEGDPMAKKSGLTKVAVKIGTAVGKADKTAHKFAKAGSLAKRELDDISKQVDALKKQLSKTTKKLRNALR
jgi:hypothetical protein